MSTELLQMTAPPADAVACEWCGSYTQATAVCDQCGSPMQRRIPPLLATD